MSLDDPNDGRAVAKAFFLGEQGERVPVPEGCTAVYRAYFHGEYDDAWIVVCDGEWEVARYNAKGIGGIVWAEAARDK